FFNNSRPPIQIIASLPRFHIASTLLTIPKDVSRLTLVLLKTIVVRAPRAASMMR
ncbi:hypothetical protein RB213_014883, partial [Colletotrichum asianum]